MVILAAMVKVNLALYAIREPRLIIQVYAAIIDVKGLVKRTLICIVLINASVLVFLIG